MNAVKRIVKSMLIAVFKRERVQELAHRMVYLARFDSWCRANPCTMVETRREVHDLLFESESLDQPIHYLEFGVYEGGTLRAWSERNRDPASTFVGFDTFRGLPEDWGRFPKGTFDTGGKTPDIDDSRVSFQVGLFQETLPGFLQGFEREHRMVVHLDADLFSSTLFTMLQVGPHMRKGDILIFDEFHDYMDEFRAMDLAIRAYDLRIETIAAKTGFLGRGFSKLAVRLVSDGPSKPRGEVAEAPNRLHAQSHPVGAPGTSV